MIIGAAPGLLRANRSALRRTGKRPGRLAHIGFLIDWCSNLATLERRRLCEPLPWGQHEQLLAAVCGAGFDPVYLQFLVLDVQQGRLQADDLAVPTFRPGLIE